jgi:ubiquitin-like-conjugating enzyme ATG3
MQYDSSLERIIDDGSSGDGWVDTHHYSQGVDEAIAEMTIAPAAATATNTAQSKAKRQDEDDDDDDGDVGDMESFDFSSVQDADPVRRTLCMLCECSQNAKQPKTVDEPAVDNRLGVRTYDLNITYDKYYQVPRLWLIGYDEVRVAQLLIDVFGSFLQLRKLLSVDEMYADFSADHARKTITMESHPHVSAPPIASVHPCR